MLHLIVAWNFWLVNWWNFGKNILAASLNIQTFKFIKIFKFILFHMFVHLMSMLLLSFLLSKLFFLVKIYVCNLFTFDGVFSTIIRTSFITATFSQPTSPTQSIHLRGLLISWDNAGWHWAMACRNLEF